MRLLWLLTLAVAFILVFALGNVNGDRKGSKSKDMVNAGDREHRYHPDTSRNANRSPSDDRRSGSRGRDSSSSKDRSRSGKSPHKKNRKNKHHKRRGGKKYSSPGKNERRD